MSQQLRFNAHEQWYLFLCLIMFWISSDRLYRKNSWKLHSSMKLSPWERSWVEPVSLRNAEDEELNSQKAFCIIFLLYLEGTLLSTFCILLTRTKCYLRMLYKLPTCIYNSNFCSMYSCLFLFTLPSSAPMFSAHLYFCFVLTFSGLACLI